MARPGEVRRGRARRGAAWQGFVFQILKRIPLFVTFFGDKWVVISAGWWCTGAVLADRPPRGRNTVIRLSAQEYEYLEREAADAERLVEQHVTFLVRQYLRGALVPAPEGGARHTPIGAAAV